MGSNNLGSQSGDNSMNVGIGDFRGCAFVLGAGRGGVALVPPESLSIVRHTVFPGRAIPIRHLGLFGAVSTTVGLIGAVIGIWQFLNQPFGHAVIVPIFLILFGLAVGFLGDVAVLKRLRFGNFLFARLYLEVGSRGRVHVTRFSGTCAYCGSAMRLRNVGPPQGPRDDMLICERNPKDHGIEFDPTALSDVDGERSGCSDELVGKRMPANIDPPAPI